MQEGFNDDFLLTDLGRFVLPNGNHDLSQLQSLFRDGKSCSQRDLSGACSYGRDFKCLYLDELDDRFEDAEV